MAGASIIQKVYAQLDQQYQQGQLPLERVYNKSDENFYTLVIPDFAYMQVQGKRTEAICYNASLQFQFYSHLFSEDEFSVVLWSNDGNPLASWHEAEFICDTINKGEGHMAYVKSALMTFMPELCNWTEHKEQDQLTSSCGSIPLAVQLR